jgi:uncharacterized protein YfdQ (DUF2303 family)
MWMYREHKVYGEGPDPAVLDLGQGGNDTLVRAVLNVFAVQMPNQSHKDFVRALTPESLATSRRLIEAGALAPVQKSFVDFVELCARKEDETDEPCRITASY